MAHGAGCIGQSFLLLASTRATFGLSSCRRQAESSSSQARCLLLADHQTKTSSQWRVFLNVESACGGQASNVELEGAGATL
jgi:hypothetical protein